MTLFEYICSELDWAMESMAELVKGKIQYDEQIPEDASDEDILKIAIKNRGIDASDSYDRDFGFIGIWAEAKCCAISMQRLLGIPLSLRTLTSQQLETLQEKVSLINEVYDCLSA